MKTCLFARPLLITAVSAGFTVLALSKYATILILEHTRRVLVVLCFEVLNKIHMPSNVLATRGWDANYW
jgi:hypothetical protein